MNPDPHSASPQVDERYRKNIQGSPQSAPPPKQPPLPPRSSEPFSNGGSSSEVAAMHRPMEPQVTPSSSSSPLAFSLSYLLKLDLCTQKGLWNNVRVFLLFRNSCVFS